MEKWVPARFFVNDLFTMLKIEVDDVSLSQYLNEKIAEIFFENS